MRPFRNPLTLFLSFFRKKRITDELDEELRFHIECETEANIARGISPGEARRAALIAFGSVERAAEASWEQRSFGFVETTLRDLRYAVRGLRHNPVFAFTVIVTLALGIGANTALFSVVNALLLRSLPYQDAERLIYVGEFWPHEPGVPGPPSPDFIAWRTRAKTCARLEAYGHTGSLTLTGFGEPERIEATNITAGFLNLLGVQPALGRNFTAEEDRPGGAGVAILGHKFWQSRFASSPSVIGRSIELDGKASTIIGVLPASFVFPDNNFATDLLVPMQLDPALGWNERSIRLLRVLARPKPGISVEAMRTEFADIVQTTAAQEPPQFVTMRKDMRVTAVPLRQRLSGDVRPLVLILQVAVALVLLIACLNVANLQIGRAAARQKEMAVRTSLGASRTRVARQLLTESLLLSLLGGAAGLGMGGWGIHYVRAFLPENLHLINTALVDRSVLIFTLTIAVVTGVTTGLAPMTAAYRVNPDEILKEGGRSITASGHHRLRGALVIAEVAVAIVLLAGAGLLIRSFLRLQAVNLGFNPHGVLTANVRLSGRRYASEESQVRFLSQLVMQAQAVPGIREAAIGSGLPVTGATNGVGVVIEGRPAPPPGGAPTVDLTQVSTAYFHALAIPLLQGRLLTEGDRENSPPVVVVNQSFAQQFFPGQEAIGKHVKFGSMSKGPWYEVVGIVENVRQEHLRSADSPNIYVPYRQHPWGNMFLILKSAKPGQVSGLQVVKLVHALDSAQPVADIATMDARLADSLTADRANMELMGIFAAVALALAAIGIFGVIAYLVNRRSHEIGIRMALGARREDVLWLVLKPGMAMTIAGIAIGLVGAFAFTRLLHAWLYEISADDPLTLAAVSVAFFLVAMAACSIPARRATRVDPSQILRCE